MRSAHLLPLLVLASACGGSSTDPGGNPPPPPTGQPTVLTIQAGDGQQADPGTAVAIPPAVLVKDAGGRPVAGATVQFAVSGGGGSVSGATATSNAQGIAAAGGWVLGQSDAQTLEAQVGSLAPVRFRATVTPLTEVTIGPAGGSLDITAAGNPYNGLRLTVPAGAYPTTGTWRMGVAVTAPALTLPEGFSVAGPALRIETDQRRADRLMTLRIPIQRVAGTVPLFVMYDPARHRMEMVPIIASDQSSITVAGSHFNPTMLLGPGPTPTVRPSQRSALFMIGLGYGIPINASSGLINHGAMLGALDHINEWTIPDMGSYLFPTGHGPATALMTILSTMYSQAIGPAVKSVWPAGPLADTAALAGLMIMARRHNGLLPGTSQVLADVSALWAGLPPSSRDSLTAINLRGMLMISNAPQLMMFTQQLAPLPPGRVTRAVFAAMYGTANSTMWFTGPANPLAAGALTLGPAGFLSKVAQEVPDATPFAAQAVLPLGGSFLYPIDQFADVPPAMMSALNATGLARDAANRSLAAQAGFPTVTVEVQATAGAPWTVVDSTLEIRDSTGSIRTLCQNCPNAISQGPVPQQQTVAVETGGSIFMGSAFGFGGPNVSNMFNALGLGKIEGAAFASMEAILPNLTAAFARALAPMNIPAFRSIFAIQPDSQLTTVSAPITLHAPVVRPSKILGWEIAWSWGDGTTTVVSKADSATHTYTTTGTFVVKATLRYAAVGGFAPIPIAVARGEVTVAPPVFVWTFAFAGLKSSTLPPGGIGSQAEDTTISNIVSGIMTNLQANPNNNSVVVYGVANGPNCQAYALLQRFPAGQVAASFDSTTATFGLLGSCGDPDFSGNLTMGTLGSGTIIGSAVPLPNPNLLTLPGGSINATMTKNYLIGTFVWNVRYSTGIGTYTVDFQALQAKP